jgi:hypothetical protein
MNSMLNDEIEKKNINLKKKLEAIRVNFLNSQLNSWYQDNPIESKLKKSWNQLQCNTMINDEIEKKTK